MSVKKEIPSSDSALPAYQMVGTEEIFHVWVCKVCKKPFAESEEKVVCEKCKHYCHADHSAKYHMRVYDHLCLVDELGINKQSYVVLHAIAHGYGKRQIKNATKLQPNEVNFTITDLKKAGLVRQGIFSTEITYKAHEVLPILESIYGSEPDVQKLSGELAGVSSVGFHPSTGNIVFAVLAVGILAIALIIGSAVLEALRGIRASSNLIVVIWIVVMMIGAYVVYKIRSWFF